MRRIPVRTLSLGGAAALALAGAAQARDARPARCFTSDAGSYACRFQPTDRRGSFRITAPRKPAVTLTMDGRDSAFGFVRLGGRNVALPGRYRRDAADRACWVGDATGAKVCVR
jgi:hypothetical protein